jgi:DNA polymerase-3 subunit delta'
VEVPPGQREVLRGPLGAARRGRMAQAWLLVGPEGVGRRAAARALVAAQFCAARAEDGAPCGRCAPCGRVAAGTHPDVRWVGPDGRLGVAEARALHDAAAARPESALTAFVLEDCERLTGFAAAALLKTLEDPPGPCLFVLIARQAEAVEPTLRSRCQAVRLRPLPPGDLAEWLLGREGVQLTREQALRLATAAGGLPGRALALLASGGHAAPAAAEHAEALRAGLEAASLAAVADAAAVLAERGVAPDELAAVLRDVWLCRRGVPPEAVGRAGALEPAVLGRLASLWDEAALAAAAEACAEAELALQYHVSAALTWEILLLRLRRLRAAC